MKIKQSVMLFAMAGMISICSVQADAEEMTETQEIMTEEEQEEQKKKEAEEYLEINGIWTSSENMTMSFTLPDSSWEIAEEGAEGYECCFTSGENRIEFQIFSGETAQIHPEDIPQDKEELQSMVEEIEVIQFETEISEEQTAVKTILEFPETETEIYRYAVSFQLYQGGEYLEAAAYTDDEQMIYILLESLSSSELL